MACVWTLDVVPFPFSHHLSAVRCCAVFRFSLSILSCIIHNTGLLSPHTSSYLIDTILNSISPNVFPVALTTKHRG